MSFLTLAGLKGKCKMMQQSIQFVQVFKPYQSQYSTESYKKKQNTSPHEGLNSSHWRVSPAIIVIKKRSRFGQPVLFLTQTTALSARFATAALRSDCKTNLAEDNKHHLNKHVSQFLNNNNKCFCLACFKPAGGVPSLVFVSNTITRKEKKCFVGICSTR